MKVLYLFMELDSDSQEDLKVYNEAIKRLEALKDFLVKEHGWDCRTEIKDLIKEIK